MKLINEFTYLPYIEKVKSLKTLKAKEDLARELCSTLKIYSYNTFFNKDFILTYSVYCLLLDYHYPNYKEKLPKFITETKDYFSNELLETFLDNVEKNTTSFNFTINDILETFKYSKKVFLTIDNTSYSRFLNLNKLLKENRLAATICINLNTSYYVDVNNNLRDKIVDKLEVVNETNLISYTNATNSEHFLTFVESNSWRTDSYSAYDMVVKDNNIEYSSTYTLDFYYYILSNRHLLPSSYHYYWDTLAKELIHTFGIEHLKKMNDNWKTNIKIMNKYIKDN